MRICSVVEVHFLVQAGLLTIVIVAVALAAVKMPQELARRRARWSSSCGSGDDYRGRNRYRFSPLQPHRNFHGVAKVQKKSAPRWRGVRCGGGIGAGEDGGVTGLGLWAWA